MITQAARFRAVQVGARAVAVALAGVLSLLLCSGQVFARDVRVGLYENPPKLFTNADGEPAGIFVDLLAEAAERTGWTLKFVRCEWSSCLQQLDQGAIDLMPDMAFSTERASRYEFGRVAALSSWSQLYARKDVEIISILDLRDKRLAMLEGSIQEATLRSMVQGFDIAFELVPAKSPEDAFRLVVEDRADAAVASHHFGGFKAAELGLEESPIIFHPVDLFFVTSVGRHADLLAELDTLLEDWQSDRRSPYYRILQGWGGPLPEAVVPPYLSAVIAVLAASGFLLVVGVIWLRREVARRTVELASLNQRLRTTLDALPDPLFELDGAHRFSAVHVPRNVVLDRPPEAYLGCHLEDVLPATAAARWMEGIEQAREHGFCAGVEVELEGAAGPRWLELSVARKQEGDGGPPGVLVLSRDVTDRKLAEQRLERVKRLYATLSQCNQAIVRCTNETELFAQICEDAVVHGGFKLVGIGRLDAVEDAVIFESGFGSGAESLIGSRISLGPACACAQCPLCAACAEDRPVWCQSLLDVQCPGALRPLFELDAGAAIAALPLHKRGAVAGVIFYFSDQENAFDHAAQKLLIEMGTDIDFALERFDQDEQRRTLARNLAEREEMYRELAESINDVIWTLDPESRRFLYVSPSVVRLRGFTPEEIMAHPFDAALTPDSAARVGELMHQKLQAFQAGTISSQDYVVEEIEQPRKDGTTVWTEVVTNFVRNPRTGRVELRGVTRDISERKAAEAEIQRLAHFDQLTGLPNRILLKDRFRFALSLAQRKRAQLAVLFLDLDHFKNINDSLGHDRGDQLLVDVASRLKACLREGDTVSRQGGDEFILLLPDIDVDGATHVALKLIDMISRSLVIAGQELVITPSIGIALYPADGTDMETLLRNADAAMYQVKRNSRNGFRFFTQEMQLSSARSLALANALRFALERDQLSLCYQPQISLQDGSVVGAEALLRWRHPEFGAVSPAEFIPVAESNGLIMAIGEWVLRHAVRQAQLWRAAGLPPLVMAVNLSATQFRHPDLPGLISCMLDECGLPSGCLELELTEAVAMDDPQAAIRIMDDLDARGVRMSIDDFGTGYSSLSHLKRFKVSKLKIDQSFVRDLTEDPDDRTIVIGIINLAYSLGMETIAEGVETEGQLDFLKLQGCDEVQGYFFSRPVEADAFARFVLERQKNLNWQRSLQA